MPCQSHPPCLDHSKCTWRGVQYMKFPFIQFSPTSRHFIRLRSNILLSTLFSNTLSLYSSLNVRDRVSHPYRPTGKIILLYILISDTYRIKRHQCREHTAWGKCFKINYKCKCTGATMQIIIYFKNKEVKSLKTDLGRQYLLMTFVFSVLVVYFQMCFSGLQTEIIVKTSYVTSFFLHSFFHL
jgi:hypothetical protein